MSTSSTDTEGLTRSLFRVIVDHVNLKESLSYSEIMDALEETKIYLFDSKITIGEVLHGKD